MIPSTMLYGQMNQLFSEKTIVVSVVGNKDKPQNQNHGKCLQCTCIHVCLYTCILAYNIDLTLCLLYMHTELSIRSRYMCGLESAKKKGRTGICIFEGIMDKFLFMEILELTLIPLLKRIPRYSPLHAG